MKESPWKKLGPAGIGVAIVMVATFYFSTGRSTKTYSASISPAFAAYISSYTAGVISSESAIRIILAEDATDSPSVGKETSVKLLEFSPSLKGTSRWLDRRTLEFKPAGRLISGQFYEVRFFLSKLLAVSKELGVFEYNFQVIPQNFELTIENVKPYAKTELRRQKTEGSLFTADFAAPAAVEQILQARQDGKPLNVNWTHSTEGKQHSFVVEDLTRKDSSSIVNLSAKGESLGITQTEERNVEVAALGDFKMMNVMLEQSGNQHVVLQFSDPLSEKQNLQGLITISDLQSLDFEIKDNEIH